MTTRATLVVCILLLGGAAEAAKSKAQTLTRKAQALEAKDPAAAQKLLEQALGESPDDPRILAELGYAAYQAKDLAAAEKATRRALKLAKDDHLKAAASYNLGLILTAKSDKAGAAAAYADAARLRGGAFTATVLAGPYASIDAFCKEWLARKDPDRDEWQGEDGCDYDAQVKATLDGHEVRVLELGWNGSSRVHRKWHYAAIQLADGWWMGQAHMIDSPGGTGAGAMSLTLGDLRVVDLGGLHAVVIPDSETNEDNDEGYELTVDTQTDRLALCAIGKSGKPSCTGSIIVGESTENSERGKIRRTAWAVTPSFPGKGLVKLTAVHKKGLGAAPKDTVGAHTVTFP